MWPQASSPGGTKCKEDGERYCRCSNFTWTNWAVVSFWVILCPLGNKINKKCGWLIPGKPNTWVKAENKSHVVIYVFEAYLVLFKDTIKMVTLHLTFKRVLNLGSNLVLWTFQPSVGHSLTAACLGSRAQMHYHLKANTFSESIVQKDKYSLSCQGIGGTASFSKSRNLIALKLCKREISSWAGFSLGRGWSVFEMFSTVSGKSHSHFGQYVKY